MTKKQSDMTPEEIARTKALGLAWRQKNRDRINALQNAKRAARVAAERAHLPVPTPDELALRAKEKAAATAEYKRKWRLQNIERLKAEKKAHYLKNREALIRKAVDWARKNKDKRRETVKRYDSANPETQRAVKANRRAKERNAGMLTKTATKRMVVDLKALQRGLCAACRIKLDEAYHLDHIVPLAAGGTNERKNFQLLCPYCNRSKGAKDPLTFMQSKGFLL